VLFQKPWVVYAKRPFRGAEHVFEYLGRYTHRVGISNHRLLDLTGDYVRFRTRGDKTVRLHVLEFIRRFLLHVLPAGFVKIRHYSLYASGNVRTRLHNARTLILGHAAPDTDLTLDIAWQELFLDLTGVDLERCPRCRIGIMCSIPLDQHLDTSPPPR
jgi:hypothetical protein